MSGYPAQINLRFDAPKHAAESLDYTFDWTNWMVAGDSITSVTFAIAPLGSQTNANDCTVDPASPAFNGDLATCWISGGVPGNAYLVTCTINTVGTDARARIGVCIARLNIIA